MHRDFRVGFLGMAALVFLSGSARSEVIDGYSAARNDRFVTGTFPAGTPPTPNPTFYLSPYDFSGVGWVPGAGPGTQQVAMISPLHYVAATHFPLGIGQTVAFRAKDGSYLTRTVTTQTQISGSDVMVGELNAPLPTGATGVANYSIGNGPGSAFVGNQVFMFGQRGRVGRQILGALFAFGGGGGLGPTTTFVSDNDVVGDFDGFGFAPGTPTDELFVEVGDSGSPSFLFYGGNISLVGHHMAQINSGGIPGNLDSFLPAYIPQLSAQLALDGYTLSVVPIPEPSSMMLMGVIAGGWYIRRRRRQSL